MVWRLETGTGRHLLRAHRECVLLIFQRTDPGAISVDHDEAGAVRRAGGPDLLVQCGTASGTGEPAALRNEFSLSGHQRSLRHLPLRFRGPTAGRKPRLAGPAGIFLGPGTGWNASRWSLRRHASLVRTGRLSSLRGALPRPDRRMEAERWEQHRGSRFRARRLQWR